jgi:site-specific DNA-methyltransferase (adenine-specific)
MQKGVIMLYKGDCLQEMKRIPDGSVDMVMTDPPYGTTACKWDSIIPLEPMWEHLKRVIKPNGAIVMTASQPFTTTLIASNMKMFKYCWYWQKERGTGFTFAKYQPLRKIEEVCVFYNERPSYNPKMVALKKPYRHALPVSQSDTLNSGIASITSPKKERQYKTYTHSYPTTVLEFARDNAGKGQHPTQKPVALMEYLIKTYTNESETVLDFAAGSFTTGVACVNLNREFIGIEQDDAYFKIGHDRINKAIEEKKMSLFK